MSVFASITGEVNTVTVTFSHPLQRAQHFRCYTGESEGETFEREREREGETEREREREGETERERERGGERERERGRERETEWKGARTWQIEGKRENI